MFYQFPLIALTTLVKQRSTSWPKAMMILGPPANVLSAQRFEIHQSCSRTNQTLERATARCLGAKL
jgi:hypothetical protein